MTAVTNALVSASTVGGTLGNWDTHALIATTLLKAGANVGVADGEGKTPLELAPDDLRGLLGALELK